MAEFRIKTSTGDILCPSEMDRYDRRALYDTCKEDGVQLFCACNGNVEYKVQNGEESGRWGIYPASHAQQLEHESWCPKSKIYEAKREYNKGFLVDEDNDSVQVHLSESLTHRELNRRGPNENMQGNHDVGGRRYPQKQQGEITISAMIKKMNMLTFRHVAFYKKKEKFIYPHTDEMIRKMYWAAKRTKIGKKRKCIADLNRNVDKVEFVYKELQEIPEYKKEDRIVRLVTKEEIKKGKDKDKEIDKTMLTVPVYKEELVRALEEYRRTYATDDMGNRNIILAGFRDKYAMYSLRFLLVNDYGLFCESNYEVQMYNAICEIINNGKFMEMGVAFYKPFEYGYGAYEDKYLEDGIIEFEGTNKKIIIEVYGRNDEGYLERKRIKDRMLSQRNNIYSYISWEAYRNEPLPYTKIYEEIEVILREVSNK